jgi:hypothetical protein
LWTTNGRISLTALLSPSASVEAIPQPVLPAGCLAMNDQETLAVPTQDKIPRCVISCPCKALILWTTHGQLSHVAASLSPGVSTEVTPQPVLPAGCLAINDEVPTQHEIPRCVADPPSTSGFKVQVTADAFNTARVLSPTAPPKYARQLADLLISLSCECTIRSIHAVISPSVGPCQALALWTTKVRISLAASLSPVCRQMPHHTTFFLLAVWPSMIRSLPKTKSLAALLIPPPLPLNDALRVPTGPLPLN